MESDVKKYIHLIKNTISKNGYMIIGTFSNKGSDMCSGSKVTQYYELKLKIPFSKNFNLIQHFREEHKTPSGGV